MTRIVIEVSSWVPWLLCRQIKSSLYSFNTLSGVTSEQCPTTQLCTRTHTSRLQQKWVVGNMLEILLAQDLNPIPPASKANVLTLNFLLFSQTAYWAIGFLNLSTNLEGVIALFEVSSKTMMS